MANVRKQGFTEASETWAEGQGNKHDVLERGDELLEQHGEMERDEFEEAIGQDIGLSTKTTGQWVGQLSNNRSASAPWGRDTRGKKEYISRKPVSEAPSSEAASANKPCAVGVCKAPRAQGSAYCVRHSDAATPQGKGAANA